MSSAASASSSAKTKRTRGTTLKERRKQRKKRTLQANAYSREQTEQARYKPDVKETQLTEEDLYLLDGEGKIPQVPCGTAFLTICSLFVATDYAREELHHEQKRLAEAPDLDWATWLTPEELARVPVVTVPLEISRR